jgi:hypothetical protein
LVAAEYHFGVVLELEGVLVFAFGGDGIASCEGFEYACFSELVAAYVGGYVG